MAKIEMIGKKFEYLTVVVELGKDKWRDTKWGCICKCGNAHSAVGGLLRRGRVKSCGCLEKELLIQRNTTHDLKSHKLYAVHQSIKQRCRNKNNKGYSNYGAQGIDLCDEWLDVARFISWCEENGYEEGMQLDRVDTTNGYFPANCQFLIPSEHAIKTNKWRWEKKQ